MSERIDDRIEAVHNAALLELYNRQKNRKTNVRDVEPANPTPERPPEDGKGQYVDLYA
jgi:hypothetical protein